METEGLLYLVSLFIVSTFLQGGNAEDVARPPLDSVS